jgi:hypothetical protein
MKSILTQIPKLIELTLDKVSQVKSPSERPEVAKAKQLLIKNFQGITKELSTLSQKYAKDEPEFPKKLQKPIKPIQESKQLSFDFYGENK